MIELLHQLADLDDEAVRLQKRFDPYLARLKGLEVRAAEFARLRDGRTADAAMRHKSRRALELDLQEVEEKLRTEQKKLDAVQSARAATVMEHELEALKTRCSGLEDDILTMMEAEETATAELKQVVADGEEAAREILLLKEELATAQADAREQQAKLATARIALVEQLTPELRKRVDQLTASKIARAVVLTDGTSCPGCTQSLRPGVGIKIRAGQFVVCDSCYRILIPY